MSIIRYPWETPPEFGQMIEVATGVHWLRLPLPMALDHVNIYVLDDGDGWTLIDTGMDTRKVRAMWQAVLDGPLQGKPVKRVVATHHHPDHIGLNGWFVQEHGAEHLSTQVAYLMGRMLTLDVQEHYTEGQVDFYRKAGMWSDLLEARRHDRPFNFGDMVHPIPLGFTRLSEGQTITMGGRDWIVRIGHGHAPHHATFWSMSDNLVLSGDQIIPSISSNIGVYPTEPDANPLDDWMKSCTHFQQFATEDQLVLPGHKTPFYGAPLRLKQLLENHISALDRLRETLVTPQSAGDVLEAVFKRKIKESEHSMALVESLAHCNYLWHAGEVSRTLSADGVNLWQMK